MTVGVVSTSTPCAYAWSDGRVFVTEGLVDLLDDEELAAAVAHEMGHLLADGHLRSEGIVVRLEGASAGLHGVDAEARADALAADLLAVEGLPPAAVVRMLEKLSSSPSLHPAYRAPIARRIELLSRRFHFETHPR